jgi:hypothetical protein
VCVWYVCNAWNTDFAVKSYCALVVFGLPAGCVAIHGRYPSWGMAADAFGGVAGDGFESGSTAKSSDEPIDDLEDLSGGGVTSP